MELDHGCDYKGSRDNILAEGAEGGQRAQIADTTTKEAGTTHLLKVQRKHDRVRS
jgi:hypothetical protein